MAPGSSCSSSRQVSRCCEETFLVVAVSLFLTKKWMPCHSRWARWSCHSLWKPDIKLHSISVFPCWNITELWKIAWLDGVLTVVERIFMLLEQRTTVTVKSGAFFPLRSGRGPSSSISVPVWLRESEGKSRVRFLSLENYQWHWHSCAMFSGHNFIPGALFSGVGMYLWSERLEIQLESFFYSNSSPRNEIVMTFFLLWNIEEDI